MITDHRSIAFSTIINLLMSNSRCSHIVNFLKCRIMTFCNNKNLITELHYNHLRQQLIALVSASIKH